VRFVGLFCVSFKICFVPGLITFCHSIRYKSTHFIPQDEHNRSCFLFPGWILSPTWQLRWNVTNISIHAVLQKDLRRFHRNERRINNPWYGERNVDGTASGNHDTGEEMYTVFTEYLTMILE